MSFAFRRCSTKQLSDRRVVWIKGELALMGCNVVTCIYNPSWCSVRITGPIRRHKTTYFTPVLLGRSLIFAYIHSLHFVDDDAIARHTVRSERPLNVWRENPPLVARSRSSKKIKLYVEVKSYKTLRESIAHLKRNQWHFGLGQNVFKDLYQDILFMSLNRMNIGQNLRSLHLLRWFPATCH